MAFHSFPLKVNNGFKIQDILILNDMKQDLINLCYIYNNVFIRVMASFLLHNLTCHSALITYSEKRTILL